MTKQITMTTNTAYLLNTWFKDNSCLFLKVKRFIEKKHERHWKGLNKSEVKIIFKVKQ